MTTDIKEAARASARISDGDEFPEPHMEPQLCTVAEKIRSLEPAAFMLPHSPLFPGESARKVVYMSPEEYAELTQRPMPWTGLTIAAAIVLACAAVALLVHAAGVHGCLR
jgi:hypothetical protein